MKSVLLIEDDSQLRSLLSKFLQQRGWTVLEAGDGEEGLRLALGQAPNVVVCDLLVPRTNGFQICSTLRREAPCKRMPIVAISGR